MKTIAMCLGVLVAACGVLALSLPAEAAEGIHWKSGVEVLPRLEPAQIADTIAILAGRERARHVVVQFDRAIGHAERTALEEAGLSLLRPLGGHAYFARLTPGAGDAAALGSMPFFSGLQAVERRWKLHPGVASRTVPDWADTGRDAAGSRIVAVYVLFHADVSLAEEGIPAAGRHGAVVVDRMESINGVVAELPLARLEALAEEDAVQWIEWPLPRMSEINDSNRIITEANVVNLLPYSLTGAGVTALVYDAGRALASHPDLQGHLETKDTAPLSEHATHVSCTIGGDGSLNTTFRGMAPGVSMVSYGFEYDGTEILLYTNPGDLEDDYLEAIHTYSSDIANSSIGTNVEKFFDCEIQGDYGVTSALIDTIVERESFRVVWANGNERSNHRCDVEGYGDYYSMAPPAGAKNIISVGALNSNDDSMTYFSSWGPTDDGRLKPDVSAPGCQTTADKGVTSCSYDLDTYAPTYAAHCGTSMSAPTVTGLMALLLEDYREQFPENDDPRNSTLKSLLAHNAVDRGNAGPDYQFGYGSVRIQRTIDFMRTGGFLEGQVFQGQAFTVPVTVVAGTAELKVTLAWDDYPGVPNSTRDLVNDLDLRVYSPSSQRYFPWTLDPHNPASLAVRTQEDHTNNIEQVVVANPAAGVWSIEVYGYDVPMVAQTFSLVAPAPLQVEVCGDGICSGPEDCYSCSQDCGVCSCVEPDGEYISHFTGLNCTGDENYFRPYDFGLHACAPDNPEGAVCGTELLTQTHISYRLRGQCYNEWLTGKTLPGFVRVHRGECGVGGVEVCGNGECNGMETCETCPQDCPSCCVDAEGEGVSHFSGADCTGEEYFDFLSPWSSLPVTPLTIYTPCRPDDYLGTVCGTEYHTTTAWSRRDDGVCTNYSAGSTHIGFVRVHRDGCVTEPAAYCGDGSCNGLEMCVTCPGDCGGPCCGNGTCDWFESVLGCPVDCPGFQVGENIEAEWGRITSPMWVVSDGSETWVTTPQGTVDYSTAAAEYDVWIETAGRYYIWTRVRAMDVWQDSFYVEVFGPDGDPVPIGTAGTKATFRLDVADPPITYGAFSWTLVHHWWNLIDIEYNYVPAVYYLGPGVNVIRFTMRDLGTQLEALRVDSFPFPCSSADLDRDGWTTCEGDCNDKNAAVNPGVPENCTTRYDDDCDGSVNERCDDPIIIKPPAKALD